MDKISCVDTWLHILFKCSKINLYSWLRNYQLLSLNEIPWIHVGVKLFTRPFLPSPFSNRPYRKGLGTKLSAKHSTTMLFVLSYAPHPIKFPHVMKFLTLLSPPPPQPIPSFLSMLFLLPNFDLASLFPGSSD